MVVAVVTVACGRVGFDALGGGSGAIDGTTAGDSPMVTSCAGLAYTCGPTGTGSCCDSPIVNGGTFARSYDVAADGAYGDSSYGATVSDFRLDKYDVTVGRFRQFVAAGHGTQASPPVVGAGAHPNIAGSGWISSWNARLLADSTSLVAVIKCDAAYQTWTDTPGGNESRPMNCIDWYEAMAFCAWDGGFLPTEAEWNYAASGGSEQRAYPWSSPPAFVGVDGTRASYNDGTTCVGDGMAGCALTDLVVVGSKPAGDGRWGQADLGGNVWQWMLDWNASPYPQNPCNDCANLIPATFRVIRGGCFDCGPTPLRTGNRDQDMPANRNRDIGVRCARTP
jgi:sulfatase modifying factor 1